MNKSNLTTLIVIVAVCAVLLAFSGCSDEKSDSDKGGANSSNLVGSVASGLATGAGLAAGHQATTHLIDKLKKSKRARNISRIRTRSTSRVGRSKR